VAEFCRREGLSRSSFDLWRRRLEREAAARNLPGLVEVALPGADLVSLSGAVAVAGAVIEIRTTDGLELRVPAATGAAGLCEVLRALRGAS
jgi:hypothetical protein